jgi:hypothetical protein
MVNKASNKAAGVWRSQLAPLSADIKNVLELQVSSASPYLRGTLQGEL